MGYGDVKEESELLLGTESKVKFIEREVFKRT